MKLWSNLKWICTGKSVSNNFPPRKTVTRRVILSLAMNENKKPLVNSSPLSLIIPKRRAGRFIFYINALPLFYKNWSWSVHVPVEISVVFVRVLWKILSTYTCILFLIRGGGGITVNCNHCPTYTESQKWI